VWLLRFQDIASIFQRFVFSRSKGSTAAFKGANCELRSQRLASGEFEPPEANSNGFRYREPSRPRSRLSESEGAENSLTPKQQAHHKTFGSVEPCEDYLGSIPQDLSRPWPQEMRVDLG